MSGDQPDLVSISTGKLAPPTIATDIQMAYNVEQNAYQEFGITRFDSNSTVVEYYDKIGKLGLTLPSAVTKKKQFRKPSGTEIILQADRNLFGHMRLAAESQKLDLKDVIAH